ncbi:MAG: phage baseplate assembly protein V [Capnocytophaga sp.]|nr:phage baseplate assembly protein V [Capnocytophaga sp.]
MSLKSNSFSTLLSDLKDVKTTVYIKGQPLIFHSLVLRQSLNSYHSFEVVEDFLGREDLVSKKSPKSFTESVGERIHIQFQHEGKTYEFIGFITEVVMDSWEHPHGTPNTNFVRYRGKGSICLLDDVASMYSFVDASLTDIVQELTYDYQSHFSTHCSPNFKGKLAFAMQYKESVFEFLNRLSGLYNELFFYDGKELFFGIPTTNEQEKLTFDEDIISLKTTVQTLPHAFSQYDYFAEKDMYVHTQDTTDPERQNMLLTPLLSKKDVLYTSKGIVRSSAVTGAAGNLDDVLQGGYNATLGNMHVIEGKTKTSRVKIGGLIRVHFSSHYDLGNEIGVYRVISLEHRVEQEGTYVNHFVAIPQGVEYSLATAQVVAYPEIAEVVSNEDPEGQGRVQVQFYWQKRKSLKTNWLRVQSSDAGVLSDGATNRGVVFIPEVGDQVMVSFEQGNPHRPYVSGSMFHGKNASAVSNNVRSIITKSGCKIVFDDDAKSVLVEDPSGNTFFMDGQGNINVNAPKNMTFTVGEDLTFNVGNNMNTSIGKNNSISIANDNLIAIENNHSFNANNYTQNLKGNYSQNIEGNKNIGIRGNLEETTASTTHIAQSGDVTIKSAGLSQLLGKTDARVNKG